MKGVWHNNLINLRKRAVIYKISNKQTPTISAFPKQCVNSYADSVPLPAFPVIGYQHRPGAAECAPGPFVPSRKCCAHPRQLSERRERGAIAHPLLDLECKFE